MSAVLIAHTLSICFARPEPDVISRLGADYGSNMKTDRGAQVWQAQAKSGPHFVGANTGDPVTGVEQLSSAGKH